MEISELIERLSKLDTACVCDADKSLKVMSPDIRPVVEGLTFAGVARTVTCDSDFLAVIKGLEESRPGEVLVIQADGNKAVAGELFATEANAGDWPGLLSTAVHVIRGRFAGSVFRSGPVL